MISNIIDLMEYLECMKFQTDSISSSTRKIKHRILFQSHINFKGMLTIARLGLGL